MIFSTYGLAVQCELARRHCPQVVRVVVRVVAVDVVHGLPRLAGAAKAPSGEVAVAAAHLRLPVCLRLLPCSYIALSAAPLGFTSQGLAASSERSLDAGGQNVVAGRPDLLAERRKVDAHTCPPARGPDRP